MSRSGRSREAPDRIEGRNPVLEALKAGRRVHRILLAEGVLERGAVTQILVAASAASVTVERVPRTTLDRLAVGRVHQGVIAEADPYRYRSWEEAVDAAVAGGEAPLLVALDGVTDPGNLGSILRSAEAAGVHAVLIPHRRASPVTPLVEKASAGALEHLVIDRVPNLERALEACRKRGIWIVGLTGGAGAELWECDLLAEPLVLVIGAEGKGISRLISERADALVRIPMKGRVESLNAAVAAAVALFEARRRRSETTPR